MSQMSHPAEFQGGSMPVFFNPDNHVDYAQNPISTPSGSASSYHIPSLSQISGKLTQSE
ncbi:hypothetical protein M422DRAFT_243610 [Sphaerobolus stellatus SS14]|nr:hypothetical protein M422DRAFT_243606 [Sphaerobolus stellatus SS14]KIJ52025.1 hypothetical protein M422DRAFT_243610 [Sphaerobolus stellatus SS14]